MSDWPELDKAIEERRERMRIAAEEEKRLSMIRELERIANERFELFEKYEHWEALLPRLDELFAAWDEQVMHYLTLLCKVCFGKNKHGEDAFGIRKVLVSQGDLLPPFISWEACHRAFYVKDWFILNLEVDEAGTPAQFRLTVWNGQELTAPVEIEKLKAILLQAFDHGYLRDTLRKEYGGLVLPLKDNPGYV